MAIRAATAGERVTVPVALYLANATNLGRAMEQMTGPAPTPVAPPPVAPPSESAPSKAAQLARIGLLVGGIIMGLRVAT